MFSWLYVHHHKQSKLVLSGAHGSSIYSLPPEEPRARVQANPFHIVLPFIMTVKHVLPILSFAFEDLHLKREKYKQTYKAAGKVIIGAAQCLVDTGSIFHHA